ncbi:hypothetical protein BGZ76_004941 [Entomortierella beljakovae]|nr:hypothetical protein BGZ76_004941 [Entomortierella beljakovae]
MAFNSAQRIHNNLMEVLSYHSKLQSLDITFQENISPVTIQVIIQACHQMDSVRLCFGSIFSTFNVQHVSDSDSITFTHDTKIRKLYTRFISPVLQTSVLLPLLEHCPLLEELEWEYFTDNPSNSALLAILKKCPQIKNLRFFNDNHLGDIGDSTNLIRSLTDILSRSSQIKGAGAHGSLPNEIGINLKDISIDFPIVFCDESSRLFVQCLGSILTNLSLDRRAGVGIQFVGELLSGLPYLESLTAGIDAEIAVDTDFQLGTQWSCLLLRQLRLRVIVQRPTGKSLYNWASSHRDMRLHYIFSQIGRLHMLNLFELGSPDGVLPLRMGYLNLLSGLKALETWDTFDSDMPALTISDAKWILKNWPKLSHIILREGTYKRWRASDHLDPNINKNNILDLFSAGHPFMRICRRPRLANRIHRSVVFPCSCFDPI